MKILGNKSLSAILSTIIRILWWIEWVGAVVILTAVLLTPFFKNEVSFKTPVSFSAFTVRTVEPAANNVPAAQLTASEGSFTFPVRPDFMTTLIMALVIAVAFAFFILITYQVKRIFSSFAKNDPFVESNAPRIRSIGLTLIAYSLIRLLYNIGLNQYLVAHFKWNSGIQLTAGFNSSIFFIGLTIVVMAEIFKLGASLENEQKLMI